MDVPRQRAAEGPAGGITGLLSWSVRSYDRLVVITVTGELDCATAPLLREPLESAGESGRHLVVDLGGLEFCGCAGLSLLDEAAKRAEALGGSLHLVSVPSNIRRVIGAVGLCPALPMALDVAAVIAELGRDVITTGR